MSKTTDQVEKWSGDFGREYTDRNDLSLDELQALYKRNYGKTRTQLNEQFLQGVDRSISILEVGSNVGNQLLCLQRMGFAKLFGIEVQDYAVKLSRSRTNGITIIEASAFSIPYADSCFDLVFTSGVLIHIHPSDLDLAMREIHRCAKKLIWGFEYYADRHTEIAYRGKKNLLWKGNFSRIYLHLFDDLELIKEERLKYLSGKNVDTMFLLRKR